MPKKINLSEVSLLDLEQELARRRAENAPLDLSTMELAVEQEEKDYGRLALQERLNRLPPEDGKPKRCPRCGRSLPVKAYNRQRTLRSVSGSITLKRNYYFCNQCRHGFYPRDEELGIPKRGSLSRELEKRIFDFAINDSFEFGAQRWNMLFTEQVSANLLRRVVDRLGENLGECHEAAIQHEIKDTQSTPPKLLVVQTDGSMLPLRGPEPWKEAKLAVLYRHEHWLPSQAGQRGAITQCRYVGVLGKQQEFARALDVALRMERSLRATTVVWVGDGALGNWRLSSTLAPNCVEVLDIQHAVEHAMDCAKVLLGERSVYLPVWQERIKTLLLSPYPEQIVSELEQCLFLSPRRGRGALKKLLSYYHRNLERMRYFYFKNAGYPIGSGVVESAHRHVLQRRMKNAGQHWSYSRGRQMVRLRAAYRTAGPHRFHRAIIGAQKLTQTGRIPGYGPIKRRASNHGVTGFRQKRKQV